MKPKEMPEEEPGMPEPEEGPGIPETEPGMGPEEEPGMPEEMRKAEKEPSMCPAAEQEEMFGENQEISAPKPVRVQEAGRKSGGWRVTKIQRKELAKLPRCEWRLANNHFLLHGYYNYRHLVFIENERVMYLGVPGIYHEKEAEAAGSWGFPDFVPVKELEIALNSEECEDEEQFGYWCRQVRHPFC